MVIPRAARWALATTLAVGAVLGLGACGSGDTASTATRAAADSTSCEEQSGTFARYITFMNDLDTDVTLEVPRSSWTCEGYSGVSTPGNLDGRVIEHPGPQPRIRMETVSDDFPWDTTHFTLNVNAGGKTLVSLSIGVMRYVDPYTYPWGIEVDGEPRCNRPVVPFTDPSGDPAWATMPGYACRTTVDGDMVLHLTKIKPS